MSGGVAWVWDPNGTLSAELVPASVELGKVNPAEEHPSYPGEVQDMLDLLQAHVRFTGSTVAQGLLDRWPASSAEFARAYPVDFQKAVEKAKESGKPLPLGTMKHLLPTGKKNKVLPNKPRPSVSKPVVPSSSSVDIEDLGKFMKGNRPKKLTDAGVIEKSLHGFVELDRAELPKRNAAERVNDFQEVLAERDELQVMTQASRCMDCGTPFCHQSITEKSGCPLGNLIPEWNGLVRAGAWHEAWKRLMSTNNFPEFTGRVCPAPCEGACVLGIIDDPVSIKSVELTIIDKAYEMGWMRPTPPAFRTGKRVAIVGSGPCGLAAADQLNKMGHLVTVYERSDRVGGLMMYGVPNMKADKVHVVQRRVDIMKQEGITFITGKAGNIGSCITLDGTDGLETGATANQVLDENDAVLLSVGATVGRDLATVPGRDLQGVHLAMEYLTQNTQALLEGGDVRSSWRQWWGGGKIEPIDANGKRVVVIGGGDTGNDCIGTAVRQGATQVINLELMPMPPRDRAESNPWPHWPVVFRVDYGHEEAKPLNGGEDIRQFSVTTKEFIDDGHGNLVGIKIADIEWVQVGTQRRMQEVRGSERVLECHLCLLALGFLGPENPLAELFGVDMDQRGNYKALYTQGEMDFLTSNPKVFAAGDCRRGQSLVVWAIREGRDAATAINRSLVHEGRHFRELAMQNGNSQQIAAAL